MSAYDDCLALAKKHGLYLDERIERRKENGVYGMYATEVIPKGTVITSFPKDAILPKLTDVTYPSTPAMWAHSAAKEIAKGVDSKFCAHTKMTESLEELRQHSLFFFSDEEKNILSNMNPILGNAVNDYCYRAQNALKIIKELDPDLDENTIITALLNVFSRAWISYGLLPVMDLFNHSESKGVTLNTLDDDSLIGYTLKEDYQAGQQIWISYGRQDIHYHAIYYNYFDPTNNHIIDYAVRAVQVLDTPQKAQIAQYISEHYKTLIFEYAGQQRMTLRETGLHIHEGQPSEKLVRYFMQTGFTTLQELQSKRISPISATMTYLGVIQSFLSANQVEKFNVDDLPPKLHRFHQALTKEKKMLEANKSWAEQQLEQLKRQMK